MTSPRCPSTPGEEEMEANVPRSMMESSDSLLHQKDPRSPKNTLEGPKSQRGKRLA